MQFLTITDMFFRLNSSCAIASRQYRPGAELATTRSFFGATGKLRKKAMASRSLELELVTEVVGAGTSKRGDAPDERWRAAACHGELRASALCSSTGRRSSIGTVHVALAGLGRRVGRPWDTQLRFGK